MTRHTISRRTALKTGLAAAVAGLAPGLLWRGKAWADVQEVRLGYILSDHHAPLMVLAKEWEHFQNKFGMYLKPVADTKIYDFFYDGAKLARFQLIPTKKGPDLEKLLAQGSVDVAITGTQAIMMSVDRGVGSRLVSPLQTEGNGFIVRKDSPMSTWQDFVRETKGAGRAFAIGIPGPDTSPGIIFKDGLRTAGISFSENPNDRNVDVVLINMKGHGNVVPGLVNGLCEAIVATQPFASLAARQAGGKLVLNLQDLPGGKWQGHSCCSVEAAPAMMAERKELLVQTLELIVLGAQEANADKAMTARAAAAWLAVDESVEADSLTTMGYTTEPTPHWIRSVHAYAEPMESMGVLTGLLKGKRGKDIDPLLFDFSFLEQARANLKRRKFLA